jgi:hypothetical protein
MKLLNTPLLLLLLLLSTIGAADYGSGLSAVLKGDYPTALREFEKDAIQGDAKAQYNLGVMYDNGYGVAEDKIEAVRWYRKAADQGDAKAQFNLGNMYRRGEGVTKDYVEVYKWWSLATTQGDKIAAQNKKLIAKLMTSAQIAEAQKLSTKWFKEHNR